MTDPAKADRSSPIPFTRRSMLANVAILSGASIGLMATAWPAVAASAPVANEGRVPGFVARNADVEAALCNCLGFGSKNSALVLGRAR